MQDTRSLDGKTTLLSYIARQLSTGPAPAALLAEEVPHVVGPALKVSVQVTLQLPCVAKPPQVVRSLVWLYWDY